MVPGPCPVHHRHHAQVGDEGAASPSSPPPRAAPILPPASPFGPGARQAGAGESFPAERRRPAACQPALARGGHLETSRERQKERISVFLTATCNRFFRAKHLCIQEALSQAISLSRGETDGELILAGRALPRSPPLPSVCSGRGNMSAETGFNPRGRAAPCPPLCGQIACVGPAPSRLVPPGDAGWVVWLKSLPVTATGLPHT